MKIDHVTSLDASCSWRATQSVSPAYIVVSLLFREIRPTEGNNNNNHKINLLQASHQTQILDGCFCGSKDSRLSTQYIMDGGGDEEEWEMQTMEAKTKLKKSWADN